MTDELSQYSAALEELEALRQATTASRLKVNSSDDSATSSLKKRLEDMKQLDEAIQSLMDDIDLQIPDQENSVIKEEIQRPLIVPVIDNEIDADSCISDVVTENTLLIEKGNLLNHLYITLRQGWVTYFLSCSPSELLKKYGFDNVYDVFHWILDCDNALFYRHDILLTEILSSTFVLDSFSNPVRLVEIIDSIKSQVSPSKDSRELALEVFQHLAQDFVEDRGGEDIVTVKLLSTH